MSYKDSMNGPSFATTHRYDFQHLLSRNIPVSIQVIHGEGPLELLLQLAPGCYRQRAEELPKVNSTISIRIKRSKNVLSKFAGISIWKEVTIDFFELVDR